MFKMSPFFADIITKKIAAALVRPHVAEKGASGLAQSDRSRSRKRRKKRPFTLKRFFKKTGRFLVALARMAARGIYYGARSISAFIRRLPRRTLFIAGSACGAAVLVILILMIASPREQNQQIRTPDATELAQAFAQMSDAVVPGALDDAAGGPDDPYAQPQPALAPEDGNADGDADTAGGEPQTATPETGAAFAGELSEGDDGAAVSTIQTRLMELGYMDPDEPTQHFGPLTKSALLTFQKHNELGSDGICGEQTYAALMNKDAKVYVMQMGDSGVDVEGVQTRLYELGFMDNKANVTGNFGEKTEEAAKLFQKKNKLTADGKVGEKTLSMLYDEDVVGNAYSVGDEAPIIKECQQKLYKLGYITSKSNVSGVFNNVTKSAIKAFQQANGLTRDGALGPQTRDLLLSNEAQEKSLQLGDYGTDVQNAQKRLVKLNYLSSSSATGYFGEKTEDAVRAFQKRNGITASGVLNSYTLKKLNASNAKKAPSSSGSSSSGSSGSSSGSSSGGSSSGGGSSGGSSSGNSSVGNKTGVEKMIAIAEGKLGSKYVRGAKGPNTFDCSGFVYYCMKSAGISCSYQTSLTWRTCSRYKRISSMGSLQRGDVLVFYGHVGLYLGNGRMIDASSSEGKVRISSTVLKSGGYWQKNFVAGFRVF